VAPRAQLAMWTSGIVVCTLLINAPLLPLVLKWTGLASISPIKARLRAKAVRSLRRFTEHAVVELEHDTGEMMRGDPRARTPGLRLFQRRACGCAPVSGLVVQSVQGGAGCPVVDRATWDDSSQSDCAGAGVVKRLLCRHLNCANLRLNASRAGRVGGK